MNLRSAIVAEIMKLVRPDPRFLAKRPTVSELEAILNSDEERDIQINPDGSVSERDTTPRTVGDVADAVLRIIQPEDALPSRQDMAKWLHDLMGSMSEASGGLADDVKVRTFDHCRERLWASYNEWRATKPAATRATTLAEQGSVNADDRFDEPCLSG